MAQSGSINQNRPELSFAALDPADPIAVWAMTEYFGELDARFEGGFDTEGALDDDAPQFRKAGSTFVVAYSGGTPCGCGGVVDLGNGVGEIKRMWVDAGFRGQRIGKRLLGHLEDCARDLGHTEVCLDTNSVLTEAIAMYESTGYSATERYNDNPYAKRWFKKSLTAG